MFYLISLISVQDSGIMSIVRLHMLPLMKIMGLAGMTAFSESVLISRLTPSSILPMEILDWQQN